MSIVATSSTHQPCASQAIAKMSISNQQSESSSNLKCSRRNKIKTLVPPQRDNFIIATGKNNIKPDEYARKAIRRHVMKGKNRKRITSRRPLLGSWINSEYDSSVSWISEESLIMNHINPHIGLQMDISPSLIGFAPGIEPHMLQLIHNFIQVMQKAMYPIENCIDIGQDERCWFEELSCDPEYTQIVWRGAQVFFNTSKSQTMKLATISEINNAMSILRQELADPNLLITDSTIFTVLALAMISETFDDLEAAQQHLYGLYQLIRLRGGMNGLSQKHSLQFKCCRLDLRFALRTGSKPLFFAHDNLSWETYLPKSERLPTASPLDIICEGTDWRLVNVWHDLRELTTAVNLAHQTKRKLSPMLFQETLVSVQYRLQHLIYDLNDEEEVLRIALLVFSTNTFFQSNLTSAPCRNLMARLKTILNSTDRSYDEQELKLYFWLIFICGISKLDGSDDYHWIRQQMLRISRALELHSWSEIRRIFKTFLWVNLVNDKPGENFFNEAMKVNRCYNEG